MNWTILEHCIFNLFLKHLWNFFASNFEAYVNWPKYFSIYECIISLTLQRLIYDSGPQNHKK